MEYKAVVMALIGFFLLYGGLVSCIGIAWYHSQNQEKKNRARSKHRRA